ncbi:MAG: RecX family transcriptional regulator [Bacteroidetes bacterium]|jgi:regulatory protein|nr:RecX family transcriptional regulator [Bacteroidota bacterium]
MKKYISQQEALILLQKYCAFQERCHSEVRTKLLSLGIYGELLEEIIGQLIEDDFLNELRFAKTYARGKFRMKAWGRIKIIHSLKQKGITDYCIKEAMKEINPEDYKESLHVILTQQLEKFPDLSPFERKSKAFRYALSRGYESGIIEELLYL